MNVFIERFAKIPGYGSFGRAHAGGVLLGQNVAQPYNGNTPFESCVPDGDYELVPYKSKKYGDVFFMVNPDLNVYAKKKT
jgi:hypothetical protein